jgi:hypothetical protein
VDPTASPFFERLKLNVLIDHDYVVRIEAVSSGRGDKRETEIHDLEFALTLPRGASGAGSEEGGNPSDVDPENERSGVAAGGIRLRSNVTMKSNHWVSVPGDIVTRWRPNWFDVRCNDASPLQRKEKDYYCCCAICQRNMCQIHLEGCDDCGGDISTAAVAERLAQSGIRLAG